MLFTPEKKPCKICGSLECENEMCCPDSVHWEQEQPEEPVHENEWEPNTY